MMAKAQTGYRSVSPSKEAYKANHVLRELGFAVVPMQRVAEPTTPAEGGETEPVAAERSRRLGMWRSLLDAGGPKGVPPAVLRELGMYGGAQGIWVDKVRTGRVTQGGEGVTVGVLHTGRSYADDLDEGGILYHYPRTGRPAGRDRSEVEATKAVGRAGLPFFVISYPSPHSALRDVRVGRVEGWDDDSDTFLIAFGEEPRVLLDPGDDLAPFEMIDRRPRKTREVAARLGQQRFKFRVLRRYGARCAACEVDVPDLLDAAHLVPVSEGGSDDPRNGLALCPTHHRAFDAGLFAIEPGSLRLCFREGGPDAERLGVSQPSIGHLARPPHPDVLAWLWSRWTGG